MDKQAGKKNSRPAAEALLIGLKLLLVCAVVSAVISGVNALTADKYSANLTEEKRKAIVQIFDSESVTYREIPAEGAVVYEVLEGDAVKGYCVEIASAGFGGDIGLMVGYEADLSLRGVGIVSLNETPGLGARVKEEAHLAQYKGKQGVLTLGKDVDAITGATISSRAVLDGVNRATEILDRAVTVAVPDGGDRQ